MREPVSHVNFPLITDGAFYAVAVPAVLLMGISKSGFGAGLGSLAVPLMALVVTVPQAAAILMPILLLADLIGIAALRKDFDRTLLRFLLPYGLLGVVCGALLFRVLDPKLVSGVVGVATLLFLAQRLLTPAHVRDLPMPRWAGRLLTWVSGFTSFIAHTGGPPLTAYTMTLGLRPVVFTATASWFFFFINLSKWLPYAWLGLLDWRNLATSVVLLPLVPLGVWAGVGMARRISPALFYRLLHWGLLLTGLKLVWDAVH